MRICLAQLNYRVGDFEGNLHKMIDAVGEARRQKADLVCFAELATCGYPPRDFLEFDDFIDLCEKAVERLTEESGGITIVVGSPSRNPVIEGKDLFNTAFILQEGKISSKVNKTLLPTYDVFDEYRYFEPANTFSVIDINGQRIAMTICEDLWNLGNENPLYTICPIDEMLDQKPELIINISASPFAYDHAKERLDVLRANVERYGLPLFYVNHVGAQTELIFDGGSVVMSPDGTVVDEMPYFEECIRTYDFDDVAGSGSSNEQAREEIDLIHRAVRMGIRDYFSKMGFSKAIVGLSGGIDSAVTTALAAEALGPGNVRALLMPSRFSSDHSVTDSVQLCENLKIPHEIIPIDPAFEVFEEMLKPYFKGMPFDVAEENIQPRIRAILLMAFSNKFGYILLNTTNKSEMAVGYGTLYGDLSGGLSVIGDIYKTQVYKLARYLNRSANVIPENILKKAPSAELKPEQLDTDSLPPYAQLDQILYAYIDLEKSPQDIIEMGHEAELVRRVLKMVNQNEFKRHQTAPVLRVSNKAFGMGRRVPIVAKYLA